MLLQKQGKILSDQPKVVSETSNIPERRKGIKNKLGLLKFAKTFGNVLESCRVVDYSSDSFYRLKIVYEASVEEDLRDISLSVDQCVEEAVVAFAIEKQA